MSQENLISQLSKKSKEELLSFLSENQAVSEELLEFHSDEDSHFDSICPHCYASAKEIQAGDEGNTFCSVGCGNIEGDGSLEVQSFPSLGIMAILKKNSTQWLLLVDNLGEF